MHARIPTRHVGQRVDAERGVSLVEVVVVLLIVAILAGSILAGRNSTKRAGAVTAARAAGASYHDAIEAFMRDHGGRVPIWGDNNDWRDSALSGSGVPAGSGAGGQWGPINVSAVSKPYLEKIPEGIASGRVVIVNSGTTTSSPGVRSRLVYQAIPPRRYRLSVQRATDTSWATACEFGTEGGNQC
jgi:prepilin-type N-terminal cleavage/methylation domain-containing protein